MRLVARNFNRPSASYFPSLWNDLFADDFSVKQAARDRKTETASAKKVEKNNMPAVNIKKEKGHYFIEVAAPGFKKSDFLVELEDNTLTISTKEVENKATDKEMYTHQEFTNTVFKRTFIVSEKAVDVGKIKASYEAGILVVSIPKREIEERKLNIDIF